MIGDSEGRDASGAGGDDILRLGSGGVAVGDHNTTAHASVPGMTSSPMAAGARS
jgi:hypothetical protein